jgi:hypothetical protein
MATVHKECITEEQRLVVRFLWAKGLDTKDIRKEMFSRFDEKCLSRKAVHNWVEGFSQKRSKVADDGTEVRKWLKQQFLLISCGLRRTSKAMGQVYQCWWRIWREIKFFFFQFRISHILRSISNCDLFTDTPPYMYQIYLTHLSGGGGVSSQPLV